MYEKNSAELIALADSYYYGEGVEMDLQKAVEYYNAAAEMGDAKAKCLLGYCLREGIGADKDEDKAFTLFEEAANAGFAMAQYNLAMAYEKKGDSDKASELYKLAKDNGYEE